MNIPNARERILQVAVKIFAEKSFEGSRIDEIAREANVPKSLIYYHFKNKEDILEALTNNFINEYISIIDEIPDEKHKENLQERMQNIYYEFGQKNADLVRVIFIDSLKKSKDQPILFKVLDAMIMKELEYNKNPNYDVQKRRVVEFFTSFIPNYAYICFADAWTKYFDIDRDNFNNNFLEAYKETHGAYHKSND